MSTPRVWGMGARTPWLCVGACVEGGEWKGREMKDNRYATKEQEAATSYNIALQLVTNS